MSKRNYAYMRYARRRQAEQSNLQDNYWSSPDGRATAWGLAYDTDPEAADQLLVEIKKIVAPLMKERGLDLSGPELTEILLMYRDRQAGISFIDFFLEIIASRYPQARPASEGWQMLQARAFQGNGLGSYLKNDHTSNPEQLAIGLAAGSERRLQKARLKKKRCCRG